MLRIYSKECDRRRAYFARPLWGKIFSLRAIDGDSRIPFADCADVGWHLSSHAPGPPSVNSGPVRLAAR
jgi:hypothetical protein